MATKAKGSALLAALLLTVMGQACAQNYPLKPCVSLCLSRPAAAPKRWRAC